jgi:hypothetical protein
MNFGIDRGPLAKEALTTELSGHCLVVGINFSNTDPPSSNKSSLVLRLVRTWGAKKLAMYTVYYVD